MLLYYFKNFLLKAGARKKLEISLIELMHSKKNESETITIQKANESVFSTININVATRRGERCIVMIFASSLLFVILLSALRELSLLWLINITVGILSMGNDLLLAGRYRRSYIFFVLVLGIVPLAILFFLISTAVSVIH